MQIPARTLQLCGVLLLALLTVNGAAQTPAPKQAAQSLASQSASHPDEDWNTLDLSRTHLHSAAPLVTETQEFPAYTRQIVRLQWRPLDPIDLYILKPKGIVKPPVMLALYGYPTENTRFLHETFCQNVTANGCATVGFLPALTGERYRMRPMKEWFVSELHEALACSTHDVQLVLNYLETRDDLDMRHAGILGQGAGATIAILAASIDRRIQAIDLINPWGDWPDWMAKSTRIPEAERSRYTTPEFQKRIANLDPVGILPHLASVKIRLLYGKSETITPPASQERIAASLPPGAEAQSFDSTYKLWRALPGPRLFAWMAQQLRAKPVVAVQNAPAASSISTDTKP